MIGAYIDIKSLSNFNVTVKKETNHVNIRISDSKNGTFDELQSLSITLSRHDFEKYVKLLNEETERWKHESN